MSVDLHIHTTASDGSLKPEEVIEMAVKLNYRAIAITDHDTISGIKPALEKSKDYDLELIPGVEINTDFQENEVHILGYFINYRDYDLLKKLQDIKKMRKKRAQKIVKNLQQQGLDIKWEEILKMATGEVIGRAHIARVLFDKGYINTWHQAFHKYIGIDCPAYEPRKRIKTGQAIEIIKKSGGIPVLAHPGLIGDDKLVKEVINMGIKGLEVYYYEHNNEEEEYYSKLASRYGLIKTGGSDCHGPENKDGLRLGKIRLKYEIVKSLKLCL